MHQKDFVPNYFIWTKPGLQEKRAKMMEEMTDQSFIDFKALKKENEKYHEEYKKKYLANLESHYLKFNKAS